MSGKNSISVYKKLVAEKKKNKYSVKNADVVRNNMKMLDRAAESANENSEKTGVYYVIDEKATEEFRAKLGQEESTEEEGEQGGQE